MHINEITLLLFIKSPRGKVFITELKLTGESSCDIKPFLSVLFLSVLKQFTSDRPAL